MLVTPKGKTTADRPRPRQPGPLRFGPGQPAELLRIPVLRWPDRPAVLNRLVRDRGARLAAGLAVAVAIPVAILFYFQYRSLRVLEQTSTGLLRQLTQATADRLVQAILQDIKIPSFNELQRVQQSDVEMMDFDAVRPVLEEGLQRHSYIDAFFLWSSRPRAKFRDRVMMFDRDRQVREGDADEQRIARAVLDLERYKRVTVIHEATINGRLNRLGIRMLYDTAVRSQAVAFVGFRVDTPRFAQEYLPSVIGTEIAGLPSSTQFLPVVVSIVDASGQIVYRSTSGDISHFEVERQFPLVFIDPDLLPALAASGYIPRVELWKLRVGFGDRNVAEIARSRIRPQLGLMLALAALMAASVFFVARAAAREVRLAELKSDFVSSVSHDLKTPLSLIQLFAETLELGRAKTSERAEEYYRIINSEAKKLSRLINNILEFSRIEAGLKRYRFAPADLATVTASVLASLENQFKQNHFAVTSNLAANLPPVSVDVEAVAQAVENLLSNAMKYSGDEREIRVDVAAQDGSGYIRVADRGIGIPGRYHRRIFRKFYRVDTDNGFGPQGSGLGLAIVEHIMRAHNGSVGVESEAGRGSTFTLYFPLRPAAEYPEAGWP